MKCRYCVYFDGKMCRHFNKEIGDPDKDTKCDAYIDKWIMFDMAEELI